MQIRRISSEDFDIVSQIVCRNFREVNVRDYPIEEMESLCELYTPEKIAEISSYAHMYVATIDDHVVGCGAIHSFWGLPNEYMLRTVFVQPELQGKGIGREIVKNLEKDEFFMDAKRIEVPASITATEFYLKMGYVHKDGVKELDDEGHYRLEKHR